MNLNGLLKTGFVSKFVVLTAVAYAADPLTTALAKLDSNAATFRSAKASIQYTTHNAVVDIDTTQSGTILLKRPAPKQMHALIDFQGADAHTVSLQGEIAQIYYPKAKTVQEYEVGKKRDLFDQVFLLGFGGSGKELSAAYEITLISPEESVNGSKAVHVQLVPKQKQVLSFLKKVDLWLSTATGYPVQQKGLQPSGDSTLLTYSNLQVNGNISDSALKLKLPKGVQKVTPQK
jgi:outer membrane lipoprotein-sorting protein